MQVKNCILVDKLNVKKMKKITSLFVLLLVALVGISQTLPNYSFEDWVSNPFPAYEEPAPWNTPNPLTSIAQVVTVEKPPEK